MKTELSFDKRFEQKFLDFYHVDFLISKLSNV